MRPRLGGTSAPSQSRRPRAIPSASRGVTLLLLVALGSPVAEAHGLNTSYTVVTVTPGRLEVAFLFPLNDLSNHFPMDANGDHALASEEVQEAMAAVYEFAERNIVVAVGASPVALKRTAGTVENASGQEFMRLTLTATLNAQPAEVSITLKAGLFETFGQQHTNLAKIVSGAQIQQGVLSLENPSQRFRVGRTGSLLKQCGQFLRLGIGHIFLGYDHLMFLFALIVIGGRVTELIKIVTAFTVAHSATLILAALQVVTLPSHVVESGIALTIAYVAAENVVIAKPAHRWVLTSAFGLVHGFGFANVLRDLGLPTRGLVLSLLSFNVGVELGQLAVVAVFFPITLWIAKRRHRRRIVLATSAVIFLFGIAWFIERAFSFSFMPL